MTHWTNYCVQIQDEEDANPEIIGSMSQGSNPIDNDIQQSETAGTYYSENVSVAAVNPRSTFTTFDVPKMLDYAGLIGLNIDEDVGKAGYQFFQAQYDNGTLLPGLVHRALTIPHGYLMNRMINVAHRQDATIDAEMMAIWDDVGLADGPHTPAIEPLQVIENLALPTLPASPGRWTLGEIYVGSVKLNCAIDMTIDFGVQATPFGCDSDVHDTFMNLDSVQPIITFTILDITTFTPVTKVELDGICGTHVDTVINLRKRGPCGAGFVVGTAAEHIVITANGVLTTTDAHTATGNQRAQVTYQLTCKWDGTNAPLIFKTDNVLEIPT